MSEQEFESYLRLLGRFLKLDERQRQTIGRELRAHMEERLEELIARGYRREDAVEAVLDEFGDAAALASDFGRIGFRRKWVMRTTAGMVTAACLVVVVSFLLPENRPLPAPAGSYAQASDSSSAKATPAAAVAVTSRPHATIAVTPPLDSPASRQTRQRLATVLPRVELPAGTTLGQALDFLRDKGGLSLDVNWNLLATVGIDREGTECGPISLENVKIESALQIILDNSSAALDVSLGYEVIDGTVCVSRPDHLDRHTIVRVYNVRDLLNEPFSARESEIIVQTISASAAPATSGAAATGTGGSGGIGYGGGGGYGGMMGGMGGYGGGGITPEGKPAIVQQVIEQLIETREEALLDSLKEAVAPGSWGDPPNGSATIWNGRLIVRHSPRIHRELEQFLQLLVDMGPSPATQPYAEASARR